MNTTHTMNMFIDVHFLQIMSTFIFTYLYVPFMSTLAFIECTFESIALSYHCNIMHVIIAQIVEPNLVLDFFLNFNLQVKEIAEANPVKLIEREIRVLYHNGEMERLIQKKECQDVYKQT